MKARNNYTPEFKAKVVLEILSEIETVNQIAAKYEISPVVISRWKIEFLERVSEVFKKGHSEAEKELEKSKEHIAVLVYSLIAILLIHYRVKLHFLHRYCHHL